MKPFGKSFSSSILDNALIKFQGILVEKDIDDHPRRVTNYHFCRSQPKIRNHPHLAGLSRDCITLLGLDYDEVLKDKKSAQYLSGSKLIEGSEPICHNYCGHQFGVWAGQLGDGRAHLLGNIQ